MRRKKRLKDIQEQWHQIDDSGRSNYVFKQQVGKVPPTTHWKATSMTWVMKKDGWKGWGRDWVDDD